MRVAASEHSHSKISARAALPEEEFARFPKN